MRSAAAAFAWEFQKRLRWGLIAVGLYFAALALVQVVVLGERSPIHPLKEMTFAFTVSVPLCAAFMYFLAVFSYGLAGDLSARRSLYPARLFTLPVSTAALAGWPMLYGTTAMAVLWTATAVIALLPVHAPVPLVWPGFFAAAFIAWLQVLTWMPYPLAGLRIIAAVLLLTTIDAVVFAAMEYEVRESLMVAMLAPQVPLAYLAARYAVGRARRGDTPDWSGAFPWRRRKADDRRAPFPSAARAQAWLEWRQHGRSLPAWLLILLPFEVLFLYLVRDEPAVLTTIGLAVLLLSPPFLAAFVAVTVDLTPFAATRPVATRALALAKLRTALTSTLCAWGLVLVAVPLGLTASGGWPVVAGEARGLVEFFGPRRAAALALLGLAALVIATWKQVVQGLAIGLTGREGLVKGSVLVRMSSLVLLGLLVYAYDLHRDFRVFLWNSVTWLPFIPVFLKTCGAAWIGARVHREGLIGDRALVAVAAAWLCAVLAVYGALAWILDTTHVARSVLLLLAILAVPLARPAGVLLALASNRHRGTVAAGPRASGTRARRAALVLVGAPVALAAAAFVSFRVRQRDDGRLVSSGEERTYRLHVPKSHDPARPAPLVISMHGGGLWGAAQMEMSGWNAVAEEHGFLVAYPSAARTAGPRAWHVGGGDRSARDVRFIADLIATVGRSHAIDPDRIYADGLSNGGGMAFLLSCRLSDRIAAIGLVASAQFLPWEACRDAPRPVPVIAFHGTEDRFTPYHGGRSPVSRDHVFPSIPTFVAAWARRNGCEATPGETAVAADVTRRAYRGCADGASVELYTVHGGGHTWPGGGPQPAWAGPITASVDASRRAWEFFDAHPRRPRPGG